MELVWIISYDAGIIRHLEFYVKLNKTSHWDKNVEEKILTTETVDYENYA